MAEYQLMSPPAIEGVLETVQRTSDGAFIPFDPANRDYQEYLAWVEAGGVPDPAPEAAA